MAPATTKPLTEIEMSPQAARKSLFFLVLLASVGFARPASSATPKLLERVVVIGASVTDGFLLPNEVHAMVTMADVIQAACKDQITAPSRHSSLLFFREPVEYGTRYARAAKEENPTLLVAVDFLFWFGYGFTMDEESRLRQLEKGLTLLEPFECPVLVGDFPDMMVAAREGVGIHGAPMISEWQVPAKETLARLNERLKQWAGERPNVHIVPISGFLDQIRSGKPIHLRGNEWPENSQSVLIDKDLLHTTFEGTIGLALLTLDVLVSEEEAVKEDLFVWDKKVIRKKVLEVRKAEREQRMRGMAATEEKEGD